MTSGSSPFSKTARISPPTISSAHGNSWTRAYATALSRTRPYPRAPAARSKRQTRFGRRYTRQGRRDCHVQSQGFSRKRSSEVWHCASASRRVSHTRSRSRSGQCLRRSETHRKRLGNPGKTVDQYREALEKQALNEFVAKLRDFANLL